MFDEVQFPTNISYGSRGGPGFNTSIVSTDGGAEQRTSRWSHPRHQYNVAYGIRSHEDLAILKQFYVARGGAANGFRFKDWGDFKSIIDSGPDSVSVSAVDQQIGIGDGTSVNFQLVKHYTSGFVSRTRKIEKPVNGTVLVSVDGSPTTAFSCNPATGLVVMDNPVGDGDIVRAGYEFDVPVRFTAEADHLLEASIDDFSSGSIPTIGLIELVDSLATMDLFFYGGAYIYFNLEVDVQITPNQGRVISFDPGGSSRKCFLPNPTNYPRGGPYWYMNNIGTTNMVIKTFDDATTIVTLAPSDTCVIVLGLNSSGDNTWYAIE